MYYSNQKNYRIIITVIILTIPYLLHSQASEKELKQHVIQLSSDKFEGRGINTNGIRYAEKYILTSIIQNKLNKVNNSYRQEFTINGWKISSPFIPTLIINNDTLQYINDFYALGNNSSDKSSLPVFSLNNPTIKNIDYNFALITDNINDTAKINTEFLKAILIENNDSLIFNQLIESNMIGNLDSINDYLYITNKNIPTYYLNKTTTDKFNKLITKTNNNIQLEFSPINKNTIINPSNILGMIKGLSDDSTIVLSAHFDHIGINHGKINPGANDNASGVSALLEIVRVLSSEETKPKYNILFAFFTAEEMGLYGSRYFTDNSPIPLKSIMANINLDMIGNKDPFHKDEPNFIYAYGPKETSSFLMNKIDSINKKTHYLKLDFFEQDSIMANRFLKMSDQANFIKSDIPALFLFNGLSPNYHKPIDTYRKLDYRKMKNVCNLTIDLIKDLVY
ncbi:M28 family metallopeptidase [Plebeiibacterium sediminum]|uniref:M20/M25/M40 family metallo-hydrolase n=1 Tax=Plebeiibacterium sediminum TaxID=2992112 RepID=A0AAE3SGR7_9BACT|nr:M20/M25/M40 family metallo-hydrolase [Plebeiobacterium sediminum]MCW3788775.1 M20/M25/M40 family metallo-hydrolase [Plebeiobacterium sediminum]